MTVGLDRREVVRDMNASPTQGSNTQIPLTPVMRPQPSGSSGVGQEERDLSSMLGKASRFLVNKKKEQDDAAFLEGKVAHAQGVAASEINEKGEAYTMGYLVRQADSMKQQLYQQNMTDIQQKYSSLTPDQYTEVLRKQSDTMLNAFGNDPYSRELVMTALDDMLPKLAKEHVQSHNEYRLQQNVSSLGEQLIANAASAAKGDMDAMETVNLLVNTDSGLPRDIQEKVILDAMKLDDSNIILNTIIQPPYMKTSTTSIKAQAAKDFIATRGGDFTIEETEMLTAKYENPILVGLAMHDGEASVDDVIKRYGNPTGSKVAMDKFLNLYSTLDKGNGQDAVAFATDYLKSFNDYSATPDYTASIQEAIKNGWSLSSLNTIMNANKEQLKVTKNKKDLMLALGTESVGSLNKEQQALAIDVIDKQLAAEIMKDPSIPPEKRKDTLMDRKATKLASMDVVDNEWKDSFALNLTPTGALNTDGTVDDNIIESYKSYRSIYTRGGALYADKYISGEAQQRFLLNALYFDDGTEGSTETALYKAQQIEQKIAKGELPKISKISNDSLDIDVGVIKGHLNEMMPGLSDIKLFNPLFNVFRDPRISPDMKGMLPDFDFGDYIDEQEMRTVSKSPEIGASVLMIQEGAKRLMRMGIEKDKAVELATVKETKRLTPILGNVIRSGEFTTIHEEGGTQGYEDVVDLYHSAAITYLKQHGKNIWGDAYNSFSNTEGSVDAIYAAARGVPIDEIKIDYDPLTRNVRMYLHDEGEPKLDSKGNTLPPVVVPLRQLGKIGIDEYREKYGLTKPADYGFKPYKRKIKQTLGAVQHGFGQVINKFME